MTEQTKVVKDSDDRIRDFDWGETGFATPAHLTAALTAAGSGASIQTLDGPPPPTLEIGFVIADDGTISAPSVETTNEMLEARRNVVREWVLGNIATTGFLAYATLIDTNRARIVEAVHRMTWFRTHSEAALTSATWWPRMQAHAAIGWRQMIRNLDPADWPAASLNGMRAGTLWFNVVPNADGDYAPISDSIDVHGPPYSYQTAHTEEYEDLLASVRDL